MNMEKLRRDYGEVLWAGRKCILGLPISFTRYILTDTTLFTKKGLLRIQEDEVELYRVFDKKITFSLFQRLVNCGTISLISKDIDTPQKDLISIKKPREVKKILDEAVKLQRDKYYVRGRDMVGAGHFDGDMSDFSDGHFDQ